MDFQLKNWEVTSGIKEGKKESYAKIKIEVDGKENFIITEGVGPVDALANALFKALAEFYPEVESVELTDYLVHIRNSEKGTAAEVKVIIEMKRENNLCLVQAISENILEASCTALVKGIKELMRR
jgi:2-isopropylmalate synthase